MTAVLYLALFSCSSDDEQDNKNVPEPKDPNENSLKALEVKKVLCDTEVWQMEYRGTVFYFQFKENGTVTSTPGEPFYLKEDVVSEYTLDYNGNTEVLLTIVGSGALKYLDSGIENTIVITECSSEEIMGTGWKEKVKMNLIPANSTEWNAVLEVRRDEAQKLEKIRALKENLSCGILRNSEDRFIAHYRISGNNLDQITFTYFDGNNLNHISHNLSIVFSDNGSENILAFEPVSFDGNEISKIYFNSSNEEMKIDGDLKVDTNNGAAIDFYLDNYDPMHKIDFDPECGYATPRLMDELWNAEVDEINLDDRNPRNIVFCPGNWDKFVWVGYKTNHRRDDKEPGHIYFINSKDPWYPVFEDYGIEYINESCSEFISAFFDSEGFYMIREQIGDASFLYMLSPTKDLWFKWEWRPGV